MVLDFGAVRGVVLDMDGVLWRGDQAIAGAAAFLDFLRARGVPFVMATNNSAKSPTDYLTKLARLGMGSVETGQILTSGGAAVDTLRGEVPPPARVYVVGGDGLRALIAAAGYRITDNDAVAVVVGLDVEFSYDKLNRAARLIRAGARFIATNDDATLPTPEGLAPGAGSILAAIRTASGGDPMIMGKPNAPMFHAAAHALGIPIGDALMIGDRLNTDITGAANVGMKTALVLTGVATRADAETAATAPDAIFDDLLTLQAAWL